MKSASNKGSLQIDLIELPPYGRKVVRSSPNYAVGKLTNVKEWFITTPAVVLLENSTVRDVWEEKAPDLDAVLTNIGIVTECQPQKLDAERR